MSGDFDAQRLLRFADRAEQLGYDSVWVGDSIVARARHEPLAMLAAIAARTESVALGTAVLPPVLNKTCAQHPCCKRPDRTIKPHVSRSSGRNCAMHRLMDRHIQRLNEYRAQHDCSNQRNGVIGVQHDCRNPAGGRPQGIEECPPAKTSHERLNHLPLISKTINICLR